MFQNLAGHKYSTAIVKRELSRCGIDITDIPIPGVEVNSEVMGILGPFTFQRAWYYYIVNGEVPLDIARKLYYTEVGKTDIRINGNCGCPEPDGIQLSWRDRRSSQELVSRESISEIERIIESRNETHFYGKSYYEGMLNKVKLIDDVDPADRMGFIDLYHIDSELGLYIFVETLKNNGLV